jgi:hypothetical protein
VDRGEQRGGGPLLWTVGCGLGGYRVARGALAQQQLQFPGGPGAGYQGLGGEPKLAFGALAQAC